MLCETVAVLHIVSFRIHRWRRRLRRRSPCCFPASSRCGRPSSCPRAICPSRPLPWPSLLHSQQRSEWSVRCSAPPLRSLSHKTLFNSCVYVAMSMRIHILYILYTGTVILLTASVLLYLCICATGFDFSRISLLSSNPYLYRFANDIRVQLNRLVHCTDLCLLCVLCITCVLTINCIHT